MQSCEQVIIEKDAYSSIYRGRRSNSSGRLVPSTNDSGDDGNGTVATSPVAIWYRKSSCSSGHTARRFVASFFEGHETSSGLVGKIDNSINKHK
ncbi:hypothetical protein SeLEV6574_g04031 [Synchytrium endobioticum]|uniref:Uncharacterized protein n=1 Tax=Synchytrium endobioticum TaxID=286115 RepID=A0A507D125_9FUNG|nr:hypothetical protein SeLEV6574_g04031 [Synchytrium endobioticum]